MNFSRSLLNRLLLVVAVIFSFSMAMYMNSMFYYFPMPQTRSPGFELRTTDEFSETSEREHLQGTDLTGAGERAGVMEWEFSADSAKKEPELGEMLASFALNPASLKTLKLSSPGVPETTDIAFFGKNPGWLSKRTFTADIFTCPPNSHEGPRQ